MPVNTAAAHREGSHEAGRSSLRKNRHRSPAASSAAMGPSPRVEKTVSPKAENR